MYTIFLLVLVSSFIILHLRAQDAIDDALAAHPIDHGFVRFLVWVLIGCSLALSVILSELVSRVA